MPWSIYRCPILDFSAQIDIIARIQIRDMSSLEDTGLLVEPREEGSRSSEYREIIKSVVSNFGDAIVARPAKETASARVTEVAEMSLEKKSTIIKCVEEAMDMMGRTGKEVFLEIVYRRYGVVIDDVVDSPHKFMRALELFNGSSASIMERHALDGLERKLKISASSLEGAVAVLEGRAPTVEYSERRTRKRRVVVEVKKATSPGRFEYHNTFTS
jgi:hypothetical protein